MTSASTIRSRPLRLALVAAACLAAPANSAFSSETQSRASRTDEIGEPVPVPAPLRAAHARWVEAERDGDPAELARLYAPDAWLQPPCSLVGEAPRTVLETLTALHALPNMNISFDPHRFDLSRSRDMAVERGRGQYLHLVGGIPWGTNVSYLRVWRKTGSRWLIAAETTRPGGSCEGSDD